MQLLRKALADGFVLLDAVAGSTDTVFQHALAHAAARGAIPEEHRAEVATALYAREQKAPTGIGRGVAIPHAYLEAVPRPVVLFIRLARPLEQTTRDGVPLRFFFILLGPPGGAGEHLDTLMHIVRLMSDDEFYADAERATNAGELLAAFDRYLRRSAPAEEEAQAEGLAYTGRPFGGILRDLRRRLPHYLSDFRDGLNTKSLATIFFLYFACLAPAVTFGGILAEGTGNYLGAVELIVATAVCGIVYALFAGQPLIILGGTGPLLVFTVMLYNLCVRFGLPFLEFRIWAGLWAMLFMVLLAVTDASYLMRYFTRFTDEIFAALISIIFIVEALTKILATFVEGYRGGGNHDRALLWLILPLGTFWLAMTLSRFRQSHYLKPAVREFVGDFGPTVALAGMTLFALQFPGVLRPQDKLPVPDTFQTTTGRPWLLDPFIVPAWACLAAAIPGLLVTVLAYLDQNITARLINNPGHRLKKGPAYHLDLALVGILFGVCSFFGLPWLIAATVRSLNHLRSLATVRKVPARGGEVVERIVDVRENRLTGLVIHVLIGLSLFLLPVLKEIPMPVLYGIFLYMGVVSMAGNQFFERLNLWLMDPTMYPRTHYLRRVPLPIIHAFTLVQAVCLGLLWLVKVYLGILFPLFIALLVPVRFWLGRYFAPRHLAALDAEREPEEEETEWV
jgi:mannitol/fructose-specific phosphotransferase system IIA component (Ntr-type)